MVNKKVKKMPDAPTPGLSKKQNSAAVSTENPVCADSNKSVQTKLVAMSISYLDQLHKSPPILLGDKVQEISDECSRYRSFEWLMTGACAYQLTDGIAQTGGRGRVDCDETGCISIYKQLGEIFDLSWKIIAENSSYYRKFFIERLPSDAKTVQQKREELLAEIFTLGKIFYRVAAKTTDHVKAIKIALEKKTSAHGGRYTVKNFEAALVACHLLEKKASVPFGVIDSNATSQLRAVKFTTDLNYETVELIHVIADKDNLTHSEVIGEAVKFFYENKSDVFAVNISSRVAMDKDTLKGGKDEK
jgi:ethanolamine utilization microcompartment shell protein EutS